MGKAYKIAIYISSFLLILFIGQVFFVQGKGYFLEKNDNVYILDNLHINGYLAVENTLSSVSGLPGDVLVGQNLLLDENKKFYFCQDDKAPKTNSPLNLDCANKSLAWTPNGLEVKSSSFQLTTSALSAANAINFNAVAVNNKISTSSPVRLAGCFSNDGWNNCERNDLKTTAVIINDYLRPLSENSLKFSAQKLIFGKINLGDEANMNNQYLCWKAGINNSCLTARAGNKLSGGGKWDFVAGGFTYPGDLRADGFKLCCHLNINF